MAKTTPAQNVYNGEPFPVDRGVGDKVGQTMDPFNISGWNSGDVAPYSGVQPGMPGYVPGWNPPDGLSPELDSRPAALTMDMRGMNVPR